MTNPLAPFLENDDQAILLDGGLATELEKRGHQIKGHPLWSARLLRDYPEALVEVHKAYLQAGTDCLITASYQASVEGFLNEGHSQSEAEEFLRLSVRLAQQGIAEFGDSKRHRPPPLVAASLGPYGAYLADGSEYRGGYDVQAPAVKEFHRKRLECLAEEDFDLWAAETFPSLEEAALLLNLIDELKIKRPLWISFSCQNESQTGAGDDFSKAIETVTAHPLVVAAGMNCCEPDLILPLLQSVSQRHGKALLAYPNAGRGKHQHIFQQAKAWHAAGARLIGGCCYSCPEDIQALGSEFTN